MLDNQIDLEQALDKLEDLKETDPVQYANSLREFNASLQSYNDKVSALIAKLES